MKIDVSIPDSVFADVERLATRLKTSRNELYAQALSEFIARHGKTRHDNDHITALMNKAVDEVRAARDDASCEQDD